MNGHGSKLPHRREAAVAALVTAPSVGEAAKAVGVGERTLWKWLALPDFATEVAAAKRNLSKQALDRVRGAMVKAVETLEAVMADTEAPHASRVSAARCVLDVGVKVAEFQDLEERLERLEAAAAGRRAA